MTTFAEKIQIALTAENARAWEQADEKFIFVTLLIEDLDISPSYARVEYVEAKFEQILAA